jgi:hypothetical protein
MAFPKPGLILAGSIFFAAAAVAALAGRSPQGVREVRYPDPDPGVDSLPSRKQAQLATLNQFKVFHDFHFTDKLKESGITFVHHIVADAGRHYKPVHYDHGTGIAVADVDGDGLYDIYFVNQVGGNELWKNLGGGKFRNITREAGVALADRISVAAAFGDIDNSGHQSLFVTTIRGGNALFLNDGQGHFQDISKEAGVDRVSESTGAFFFDYDNDGLVDLLVCNVGKFTTDEKWPDGSYIAMPDAFFGHTHAERFEHPVLYKNLGHNKFKDVTVEMGLNPHGWCGDGSFADLNGDGFPDLFILNMQGPSHYFENQAGKKFVDKTSRYFPATPYGSMGIKFFDYDNDGQMDLLLTDMHSDMFEEFNPAEEKKKTAVRPSADFLQGAKIFGNAFYHNLGGGNFEEISDRLNVENYWPWGPSVADMNADGWDDIFITAGMNFPFRYGINSLLLNNRGEKFLDAEFILGIEPRREGRTHTPWFDMDCGEKESLGPLAQRVCQGQSGRITLLAPLASRSAVIFDLDNDGDLDIVTNDFNSEPQVLISDLAQRKPIHWLKILLNGTVSNRNGLGATVRVHAGGRVYTKYNDGKSGYLSQSVLPLYFGLGDSSKIERVEVVWPSGRKQALTSGLRPNETLAVTEPK